MRTVTDSPVLPEKPKVLVAQWIPVGINNMISLNRHLGSHKRYTAPTEFGMIGEVEDVRQGTFEMKKNGVFLYPVGFDFSDFVKIHLKTTPDDSDAIGMKLDREGLLYLGIDVGVDKLDLDSLKILIGQLTYRSVDYVFPILTDVQQDMLGVLYNSGDIVKDHHVITTYGLVVAPSLGVTFENSTDFLSKYPNRIDAITDWVIDHTSVEHVHIFVGMRATICIGQPSKNMQYALENLLFLKSIFNSSLNLFSLIWTLEKRLKNISLQVPEGMYKQLKQYNFEIGQIQHELSLLKGIDEILQDSIGSKKKKWEESEAKILLGVKDLGIMKDFDDEIKMTKDRRLILEELSVFLSGTRDSIEERMDLIMTKNSEYLNLIMLSLTIITVFGVAEVVGFGQNQWELVGVVLIPFMMLSFVYIRNIVRNFR